MNNSKKIRPEYTKDVGKIFTDRLKNARKEHKISQSELGELIGETNKDISSLETARRRPTLDELQKLCDLLNKTENYFFPNGTPELKHKYVHKFRNNKGIYSKTNEKVGRYGEPRFSSKELEELNTQVTKNGTIYDVEEEIKNTELESSQNLEKNRENNNILKTDIDTPQVLNEVEIVNNSQFSKGHVIKRKITITLPNGYYQNVAEGINITVEEEIIKE